MQYPTTAVGVILLILEELIGLLAVLLVSVASTALSLVPLGLLAASFVAAARKARWQVRAARFLTGLAMAVMSWCLDYELRIWYSRSVAYGIHLYRSVFIISVAVLAFSAFLLGAVALLTAVLFGIITLPDRKPARFMRWVYPWVRVRQKMAHPAISDQERQRWSQVITEGVLTSTDWTMMHRLNATRKPEQRATLRHPVTPRRHRRQDRRR